MLNTGRGSSWRLAVNVGAWRLHSVKGGTTPGPGQAAMQKIFWTMLGELRDQLEITGKDGGPIQTENRVDLERLSFEEKQTLLEILEKAGAGEGNELAPIIIGAV